jgi:hypothetical protein
MFKKLLESLDEKVFTPELKENLETKFNEAVELKAISIADTRIDEEIESLNEKSEQHIDFLNQKAEEYIALKEKEIIDSLDKYLDKVVEEFIEESQDALIESHKTEKVDMLLEAFDSILIAAGVSVAQIVEAKDNTATEKQLTESIEKYDSVIEDNIALKEENEKLIRMGIIAEMCEGLSIVESEKFKKLAELVEFSRDKAFATKLETIKENVKGASNKKVEEHEEVKDCAYTHLI